jgi:hypothetical protein
MIHGRVRRTTVASVAMLTVMLLFCASTVQSFTVAHHSSSRPSIHNLPVPVSLNAADPAAAAEAAADARTVALERAMTAFTNTYVANTGTTLCSDK